MKYFVPAVALVMMLGCGSAVAQNYSFAVPEMILEVTPHPDASATLQYTIKFHCDAGADPIDVVDVGLPHKNYDIGNMTATINGHRLSDIRPSEYIDIGVEVHLGEYAIQPGEDGIFQFSAVMPDLVYQDTTRADYASLQITPTWFDSDLLSGTTKLGIVVYLPESIKLDEILYQNREFTHKVSLQDKSAVAWVFPATTVDKPHKVGVAFPKRIMARVVHMTRLGLAWKWWKETPGARTVWAIFLLVLFGVYFFRTTKGTGVTVYIVLAVAMIIAFAVSPAAEALALPVLLLLWWVTGKRLAARRRSYLPAIASVEAGGIKRGLTVPEAAVIMELPLGKVLTLLLFGMLKKGLIRQTDDDPFTVELNEDYIGTRSERQKAARKNGTVIRGYEQPFLDKLQENPGVPIAKLDLRKEMRELVKRTAKRMAGFNLEQTRDYYRSIVAGAWAQARNIGEVGARTKFLDENLLWLMLDENYDEEFVRWRSSGYHYRPVWVRSSAGGGAGAAQPAPAVGGRTSLRDVAASFAGWSENVTNHLASTLDPVSVGLTETGGIDLSGVDRVTLKMLETMMESSGSGGGGGCACAGCACACACAGGGR